MKIIKIEKKAIKGKMASLAIDETTYVALSKLATQHKCRRTKLARAILKAAMQDGNLKVVL